MLRHPQHLVLGAATLMFCTDDQAVCYWGLRHEEFEEDDPPVAITYSKPSDKWAVAEELDWTLTHAHLSNFLDDLTYLHAFGGGAIHGGCTAPFHHADPPALQFAWLDAHWSKVTAGPLVFGLSPDTLSESGGSPSNRWPTLYVREGQALYWASAWCLAAREAKVVDEISQRFQIRGWARRW